MCNCDDGIGGEYVDGEYRRRSGDGWCVRVSWVAGRRLTRHRTVRLETGNDLLRRCVPSTHRLCASILHLHTVSRSSQLIINTMQYVGLIIELTRCHLRVATYQGAYTLTIK